jgi:hypothetical protein
VPVQEDLHLSVHSGSTGAKPETRAGLRSGEVEQDERLQALVIINLETVLCSANQSLGFPTLTLCRLLSNITLILVFGKKQALRRQPLTTQIPQLTNRRRIHPEMQREDAMRGVCLAWLTGMTRLRGSLNCRAKAKCWKAAWNSTLAAF